MKVIRAVINTAVAVAVAVLCAVFLLPRVFGYQPYMVVSASMKQVFPVGSLIFVTDAAPEDIKVGDPITFTSGTLTITHRVVAIDNEQRTFTTKGDNNRSTELISFDNLQGKALNFAVPYMGYFAAWFITTQGRIITLTVLSCLLLLSVVIGKMAELENEEETAEEAPAQSEALPAADSTEPLGTEVKLTPESAAAIINEELDTKEGEINE